MTASVELGVAAINLGVAWQLLQHFGTETFSDYLSIASLVGVFSIPSMGVQNTLAIITASQFSSIQLTKRSKASINVPTFTLIVVAVWLALGPIASKALLVGISDIWFGSPLVLATVLLAAGSGFLQGSGAVIEWRLLILATTTLQVPIVLLIRFFNLTLSNYLLLASLPSLVYVLVINRKSENFRPILQSSKVSLSNIAWPIQLATSSSLLILLNGVLFDDKSHDFVIYLYIFNFVTTVATTFGSNSFARLFRSHSRLTRNLFIQALVGLMPLITGLALILLRSGYISRIQLFTESDSISNSAILALTASAGVWSLLGFYLYSRIELFGLRFALIGFGVLSLEVYLIFSLGLRGEYAIWLHSICGIVQLFVAIVHIYADKSFSQAAS